MSIYSIKDLEKLSGIKAHTIRIWEQRYNLIQPKRTETNIRYYDDEELRKLLNVALLNKNGYKISKIAQFSTVNLNEIVAELSASDPKASISDNLTIAMINMDESKFHQVIDSKIKTIGFELMMIDLIFPFLDKLYLLWLTGSINSAHENFISSLIRQKIIVAIEKLKKSDNKDVKFMLYLPEGEQHELSLLFMYYLVRSRGFKVFYLGQDISIEDVAYTYLHHKPQFIYTIISETFTKRPINTYVDGLLKCCSQAHLLLSGYQVAAQGITSKNNLHVLNTLPETIDFLDTISNKS